MEKVDIIIQIEAERLKALDFFLFDKQKSSLKAELEKAAEGMYEKFVPEDTRRYIDSPLSLELRGDGIDCRCDLPRTNNANDALELMI